MLANGSRNGSEQVAAMARSTINRSAEENASRFLDECAPLRRRVWEDVTPTIEMMSVIARMNDEGERMKDEG